VAVARPDVEAAGTEGPFAPMFEGRSVRQSRILVDEDTRRSCCIHLIFCPSPASRSAMPLSNSGHLTPRIAGRFKSGLDLGGLVGMRRKNGPWRQEPCS